MDELIENLKTDELKKNQEKDIGTKKKDRTSFLRLLKLLIMRKRTLPWLIESSYACSKEVKKLREWLSKF